MQHMKMHDGKTTATTTTATTTTSTTTTSTTYEHHEDL